MPDVDTELDTVGSDDPRWQASGISYRRLDYWTTHGYLRLVGDPNPGSGYIRRWPASEVRIAARMVRIADLSPRVMPVGLAELVARSDYPVQVAPGVWMWLTDPEATP